MNKLLFLSIAVSTLFVVQQSPAQGLQTAYDQRGLTHLRYNGVSLINLDAGVGDAFYVGEYNLGGSSAWGGLDYTSHWDAQHTTLTWAWYWGAVPCQFATPAEKNTLVVTI